MAVKQTAGRDSLGDFAPKFAELNDDVLFGEVWSREDKLSLRDRSLVTVTALMAQGLVDSSFRFHLESAKKNGITRTEIAEILTHAAFYAGWPKAWAAFRMAKEVWAEAESGADAMAEHARGMIFPIGAPNDAFAQYFIGQSYLAPVSTSQVGIFNVTFEPGCRNNWHIHRAESGGGQILICINGRGWYQAWGEPRASCIPAMWSTSPSASSTGTARRATAGSPTSPWRCPAYPAPASGSSPWTTRPTASSNEKPGPRQLPRAGLFYFISLAKNTSGSNLTAWLAQLCMAFTETGIVTTPSPMRSRVTMSSQPPESPEKRM